MQPYIFPYIGYYQLIASVDKFIIYDDVNYINKGWIDRNRIIVNSKPHLFKIPLRKKSQNLKICQLELTPTHKKWHDKFMKTLVQNYSKSDYFEEANTFISRLLDNNTNNFSEFLFNSIHEVSNKLDIKANFFSSRKYDNQDISGQNRILDICIKEGATEYINLPGGQGLYSKELFNKKGIKLSFLNIKEFRYKQNTDKFVPSLSIIDLLMNININDIKRLIQKYNLS